jgi:SAM-dependent methyltransferase
MGSELLQQTLYDRIFDEYEQHYDDACSQSYRNRFIYGPLFGGLRLQSADVLEAMCGSGQTTQYLLDHGAHVTGLDISAAAMQSFGHRFPQCRGICTSILESALPDRSFDYVVVVGGLHHVHPQVSAAVAEIHRLLRSGGYFLFVEPHAGSLPDVIRRFWYRRDRLFAANEAAIDLGALRSAFRNQFEFSRDRYQGNLAYLLVLNSLVLRIPVRWKRYYTPGLLWLEGLLERLQTPRLSCFAACAWRKR